MNGRKGTRYKYFFKTPEADRRYLAGYIPDASVCAQLRAGIQEFRRMLEGVSRQRSDEEVRS